MASIPPPPNEATPPAPPPTGHGSRITVLAIVAIVAVVAIVATVIALANTGGSDDGSPTPSNGTSVGAVAAPEAVAAHPGPFHVVLTWAAGAGVPAERYLVSRNGTVTSNLSGDITRWVDDDVVPRTRYAYSVAAVAPDGTSEATRITTQTTSAPPGTAPLDGVFDVHVHATSHYGFANFGSGNGTLGWRLTPMCAHGPCDSRLADLHAKGFRMTLARSGASYHGSATVSGQVRCGSATVTSNVTITMHVTDGGVVDGAWVATRIEGTMVQTESEQLGCVASGATYDVVGRIVR
jgi:hypothetical protein